MCHKAMAEGQDPVPAVKTEARTRASPSEASLGSPGCTCPALTQVGLPCGYFSQCLRIGQEPQMVYASPPGAGHSFPSGCPLPVTLALPCGLWLPSTAVCATLWAAAARSQGSGDLHPVSFQMGGRRGHWLTQEPTWALWAFYFCPSFGPGIHPELGQVPSTTTQHCCGCNLWSAGWVERTLRGQGASEPTGQPQAGVSLPSSPRCSMDRPCLTSGTLTL